MLQDIIIQLDLVIRINQYLPEGQLIIVIVSLILFYQMKRFTSKTLLNLSTFQQANQRNSLKLHRHLKPFKHNNLIYKLAFSFSTNNNQNISSREIDIKISDQRWKNLQHSYKSLHTSFGLKVPTSISKDYPTPDRILFNLQTLRECSNQYPEYLFEELKKPQSKFVEVIDDALANLWRAQKKQTIEFILFVIHWKIHLRNEEIGEMLLRTIKKMELNLFDMFELCKTVLKDAETELEQYVNDTIKSTGKQPQEKFTVLQMMDPVFKKLLTNIENMIILRLQVMQPQQYQALFKLVNLFRFYDMYPQVTNEKAKQQDKQLTFFQIIQKNLLKNLTQIPPSSLVIMAVHYANNTKQNQQQRIQILQQLQERILFNLKFFNHEQLVALLYSYMRTSMMSQEFTQQFVARLRLVYAEMSWENKKKILSMSANFLQHQKMLIISEAHYELLKGKPVITKLQDGSIKKQYDSQVFIDLDYQLVPEIYLASYQNSLLTEELTKKMQQIILSNIYNYDREEVVRSVWLFTVSPSVGNNLQRLHKKLEVIIEGGFQGGEYTIKDISIIVWSLCNSGTNNRDIYKSDAKFWDNIEFYLEEKLSKQQPLSEPTRLSNISSILWAYTFNRPLKFKTVSLITDILLQEMTYPSKQNPEPNLQPFELINVITFYYSLPSQAFPKSLVTKIKQACVRYFEATYTVMNSLQLMKCLKYLTADQYSESGQTKLVIKMKVWEGVIGTFASQVNEIQYEHIMGIVGLVVNSPLGRGKDRRVVQLVNKLLKRKKALQQLKAMDDNGEKGKM